MAQSKHSSSNYLHELNLYASCAGDTAMGEICSNCKSLLTSLLSQAVGAGKKSAYSDCSRTALEKSRGLGWEGLDFRKRKQCQTPGNFRKSAKTGYKETQGVTGRGETKSQRQSRAVLWNLSLLCLAKRQQRWR